MRKFKQQTSLLAKKEATLGISGISSKQQKTSQNYGTYKQSI